MTTDWLQVRPETTHVWDGKRWVQLPRTRAGWQQATQLAAELGRADAVRAGKRPGNAGEQP